MKINKYILLLILIICFCNSCGLEEYIESLEPPIKGTTSNTSKLFQFNIGSDNNESELRGIEIYYRFYKSGDTIPDSIKIISKYDDLASNGFFRLMNTGDILSNFSRPLISVPLADRGDDSTIDIDFYDYQDNVTVQEEEPFITASTTDNGLIINEGDIYIKRAVEYPYGHADAGELKPFYDMDESDTDLSTLGVVFDDEDAIDIQIVIYALSYGIIDIFNTLYSKPVYLGTITLVFKNNQI